jgi:putative peptidoglycan lipid II flippase
VGRGAAAFVAAGILASRIFGLVRQRVVAHFLGQTTVAADAFAAAFRIPNFLQNLFGEGVLSASLIPEYTRLVARGDAAGARRLAGAVAGLLGVTVTLLAAGGALAAPLLVDVLTPGFAGGRRDLAVTLVRIMFPGVGVLVLSAWCLAILNSHRRFLLSYSAPVLWNVAIIAATLHAGLGGRDAETIVRWTVVGAVAGSALQLAVQLPPALRLLGGFRPSLRDGGPHLRAVLGNFWPAFLSRGVVQVSAFLDTVVASLLPLGAVAALSNSQMLYLLPISLFGMSVAAAELPELAEAADRPGPGAAAALRARLAAGGEQVAFFIVPTALAFLSLGHVVAGVVFQSGAFTLADAYWVWGTLAAATVGLLPQALSRLLTSAHFALGDTRTPLRFAGLRVVVGLGLGLAAALGGPRLLGIDPKWGTAGLALGTALAGLLEFALLRRSAERRVGAWRAPAGRWSRLLGAGAAAKLAGLGLHAALRGLPQLAAGLLTLAGFGAAYLGAAAALGLPQVAGLAARFGGRR